ncbi:MAG: hypothetical protein OXU79_10220 [Gemmatimonadota bacterium]|nr:hypothetical protein [Gemmatimonadota bacterium]
MTAMRMALLLCFLLLATPQVISAGEMEGRSRIELRMGLRNHGGTTGAATTVGPLGVETTAGAENVFFSLGYSRWMSENVAGHATLGVLSVDASSRAGPLGVSQQAAVICPMIVGMRYYPRKLSLDTSFMPFLTAGVGLITGIQSRNDVGFQVVQESGATTTFGSRSGVGFDVAMGRSFVAIADLGYNLMTDFSDEIGGRRNYSGLESGLGIGWQFGRSAAQ